MKVLAVSDLHVDFPANYDWLKNLSNQDYTEDLIIVAGDVCSNLDRLEAALCELQRKFRTVCYTPGNHELWVRRSEQFNSLEKLNSIMALSDRLGVHTGIFQNEQVSVIGLTSWYDYSFGARNSTLNERWSDYYLCSWPNQMDDYEVATRLLNLNHATISGFDRAVTPLITFSHFLPRIDVMPRWIPASQRYLYPVLGSNRLQSQLSELQPDYHIYGHSHVNNQVRLANTTYINNALGYPREAKITRRELVEVIEL